MKNNKNLHVSSHPRFEKEAIKFVQSLGEDYIYAGNEDLHFSKEYRVWFRNIKTDKLECKILVAA